MALEEDLGEEVQWIRKGTQFLHGSRGKWTHGFNPERSMENLHNWFGRGFYGTDSAKLAGYYTMHATNRNSMWKIKGMFNPHIYTMAAKEDLKLLDLEKPLSGEFLDALGLEPNLSKLPGVGVYGSLFTPALSGNMTRPDRFTAVAKQFGYQGLTSMDAPGMNLQQLMGRRLGGALPEGAVRSYTVFDPTKLEVVGSRRPLKEQALMKGTFTLTAPGMTGIVAGGIGYHEIKKHCSSTRKGARPKSNSAMGGIAYLD